MHPLNRVPLRHPRTLAQAFPRTVEAAGWLEHHRSCWRWSRPLFTAFAGLAVTALLLAALAGCLARP